MAPDAPEPIYDSHGNLVAGWHVGVFYDPTSDAVHVYWATQEGSYARATTGTRCWPAEEVGEALEEVQRRAEHLGARRLF